MWVRLGVAVVKLLLALGRGLPARCMVQTPFGPLMHSQILAEHMIRALELWQREASQKHTGPQIATRCKPVHESSNVTEADALSRAPEVWDATGCGDACPSEDNHCLAVSNLHRRLHAFLKL